jgi:CubicO group peptidase (beta-lactamase class C family)
VFSTTKGVAALTIATAQSQGLFSYDDTLVAHWPEFAQHGKHDITL